MHQETYIDELHQAFFEKLTNKDDKTVDLLKAIFAYRKYPKKPDLYRNCPEIRSQKKYINLIYDYFDKKTKEELADLAIELINE